MFTLFKQKVDPEQARIEISDLVERIEVTAFPVAHSYYAEKEVPPALEKVALERRPITLLDLRMHLGLSVGEEELFVPNYARQEFYLDIGCSGFYIAEGILAFPGLSGKTYGLKFGLPTHYLKNYWWFLSLKDGDKSVHGYSGEEVIRKFLVCSEAFSGKDVSPVAKLVAENIRLHLLGPEDAVGDLLGRKRAQDLIAKGYEAAKRSYRSVMEEQLKEGIPDKFNPKTFVYGLVGDAEIKPLSLIKQN